MSSIQGLADEPYPYRPKVLSQIRTSYLFPQVQQELAKIVPAPRHEAQAKMNHYINGALSILHSYAVYKDGVQVIGCMDDKALDVLVLLQACVTVAMDEQYPPTKPNP